MVLWSFEKLSFLNGRRSGFNVAVQNKYTEFGKGRQIAYYISLVYWGVALGFCLVWTFEQISVSTHKLIHPPISTKTRLNNNETLHYPAVTLCYKNEDRQGYKLNMLKRFNLTGYWKNDDGRYYNNTWENFDWGQISLTELWNLTTYKANIVELQNLYNVTHNEQISRHMSIVASLNNDAKALSNNVNYFYEHGRCYTFRPKEDHAGLPPGSQYGYRFWLNYKYRPIQYPISSNSAKNGSFNILPHPEEYKFLGGWDVYIHDPKESWSENEPLTNSHHEHFFVETGTKAQIKIGMIAYNTLNMSSDPCGTNSITLCKESCRWEYLMESIGINCSLPFTYPKQLGPLNIGQCNTFNDTMSMMYHYRDWFRFTPECTKRCWRNCAGTIFTGQLLRSEIMKQSQKSSACIEIYFPSGMYMNLEEENAYGIGMFLADMGGVYGFALGISVITLLEFLDWILLKICRLCNEKFLCKRNRVSPDVGKYFKYASLPDLSFSTEKEDLL